MFPILAKFYNVTTDELLGVDITKSNEEIEEYKKKVHELNRLWKLVEQVELCRKACFEFPGSEELLYLLAWSLGQAQNVIRTKNENLNEAIEIGEKILSNSTNTKIRLNTTSLLCYMYH